MIAWINGKMVVGTPEEVAEYDRIVDDNNSGKFIPIDYDDWRYRDDSTGIEYLRYGPVITC